VALLGEHEYRPAPGRAGDGIWQRQPDRTLDPGVVHHSDAGPSTRIGLFKTEVIRCQGPWRHCDVVEGATLEWVDWYDNRRLFEALGDIPPAEAESAYYATMTPSESPRMAQQTLH
jgi:transposase InsO family protein